MDRQAPPRVESSVDGLILERLRHRDYASVALRKVGAGERILSTRKELRVGWSPPGCLDAQEVPFLVEADLDLNLLVRVLSVGTGGPDARNEAGRTGVDGGVDESGGLRRGGCKRVLGRRRGRRRTGGG